MLFPVGTTKSNDPTPDLGDLSVTNGKRISVALRGLFPLRISHAAEGSCPGLGIIQLTSNRNSGELAHVLPTSVLNCPRKGSARKGGAKAHGPGGLTHRLARFLSTMRRRSCSPRKGDELECLEASKSLAILKVVEWNKQWESLWFPTPIEIVNVS